MVSRNLASLKVSCSSLLQGEVRFEPNRNLDHTASEDIVKSIVVTSSDSDNDVLTSTVTLTITDGDIPTIDAVPSCYFI